MSLVAIRCTTHLDCFDAADEDVQGTAGTRGQVVCIPRGAVHRFDNNSDMDATALCIVSPGVLGPDYFRDVAAVIQAAAGGPPDPSELAAAMRRHGLTPAP